MDIIDLETFKQLVRLREFMNDIIIDNSHYQYRLDDIYKELNELIMDMTMDELQKENDRLFPNGKDKNHHE